MPRGFVTSNISCFLSFIIDARRTYKAGGKIRGMQSKTIKHVTVFALKGLL